MDVAQTVATYGAAWNERDADARAALLEAAWSLDGTYQDPTGRADGRDALVAHIGGFQQTMPGHTIDQESGVDVYGNVFRFAWSMRNADGVVLEGFDYGELDADGRIARIVGFFGPFPPLDG